MTGRVAVAGAGGYIGGFARTHFEALDFSVTVVDTRTPVDIDELRACSVLINCVGSGTNSDAPPTVEELEAANVAGAETAAALAELAGCRLIHLGSATERLSQDDDLSSYAGTKRRGSELVSARMREGVIAGWILQLHLTYGRTHSGLPARIAAEHFKGQPFSLRAPDTVRDLVHIDDVLRALHLAAIAPTCSPVPLEIGTGIGIRLRDLAQDVGVFTGIQPGWVQAPGGVELPTTLVADPTRAIQELNFSATIGLQEGLRTVPSRGRNDGGGYE